MKKNRTKRILSMLLTLCMVLTLVPITAFAANDPASSVTLTTSAGQQTLNASYPYLVGTTINATGTLDGTTCTAHLNATTGTLSLWNFEGNSVLVGGAGGAQDLTVKLKGSNTISGLHNNTDGGNLIITAEDAASLSINNLDSNSQGLYGIATYVSGTNDGGGSISITGKANITIGVTNTSTDGSAKSYGIFTKQGVTINDDAELNIKAKSTGATSGHMTTGIWSENQSITINTTGDITVDTSGAGEGSYSYALHSGSFKTTLTKVGTMVLKWTQIGTYGTAYTGALNYGAGNFDVAKDSDNQTETYTWKPATYTVTVIGGGSGVAAAGATVNITANAPAEGKVFDKWTTSDGVTFANANSATTTFVMPAKAVTVTATYKDAPVTTYAVTVNSGTGSGNFAEGATVTITANAPATGKVFDKWTTSDGVTFGDANTATTTFVMPAKAVTVTATYKDAPFTTYAVTVTGGGSGATGAGSYTKGTTVNINAGSRSSYTFTGWTSSDVTITNPNNTNASFVMPEKAVTVTANWSYSGGGGGGGSSSTSTIQPTVPAANGSIQVNYTASGGTAVLTLPGSKVDKIIARSKDGEVDIDLSKMGGITSAELPKMAVKAINEAGVDVTIKFPAGSITLKKDATVSIVGQAEGGSLKLELKQVAKRSLTDEQKEAVKSNDLVLDINISSGTKKISSFDGTLSITVPYSGPQPVAVWYLNDKGELEKLFCTFVDGTVSFNLDHLSLYVVGQDTAWVNPFADAKKSDWFYGSVEYAFKNGLMVGTSDTTFSPYMNTTRGMIVTILHRLEGRPKSDAANAFTDVGADKYYTDAVAWARDNIIVSGYGNGMFGPEDSITREQMAVILMNYAKYKGYDISMKADLSKFSDEESISPWAKDAISWANAEGLIQGSGSQLMPVDNALRCQVAAILQRFIETIAK